MLICRAFSLRVGGSVCNLFLPENFRDPWQDRLLGPSGSRLQRHGAAHMIEKQLL
jgi:hypothetical protein